MRKKLVRKKIKMFTAIISIFLLISMVVSGIYVYITYQTQKDLLYKSAQSRYGDFIDAWESSLNDEYFFILITIRIEQRTVSLLLQKMMNR